MPSKAGVAEPAPVAEDDIEELDLAEEAVPLPDAPEVDLVPEVDEPKNVPQAFQAEPQASPAVVYVPVGPSIALGQYGVASAAIASVVLGILSVLALFVTGIPAILAGHLARNKIRRSGGAYSGDGLAVAGLIMGYVTTAVSILWIVLLLGGFSVPGSGALRAFNAERQVRSEGVELALVLKKYAAAHATRFPPSLKKLVEEKAIDSAKLAELQRTQLGPSWTGQPGWRYLGDGAPDSDANDRPLLVSHMADGGGHHLVIYHDATSDKVEIVGK